MLARQRSGAIGIEPAVAGDQGTPAPHRAEARVRGLGDEAVRAQMLFPGEERPGGRAVGPHTGDSDREQRLLPVVGIARQQDRFERVAQLRVVRAPTLARREALVRRKLRGGRETRPLGVVQDRQEDPAAARPVQAIAGRETGQLRVHERALGLADVAQEVVGIRVGVGEQHVHPDRLARAVPLAREQAQQGGRGDHHRRVGIGVGLVGAHQLARRLADLGERPALRGRHARAGLVQGTATGRARHGMRGGPPRAGSVRPVAVCGDPDDVGAQCPRLLVGQPQAFGDTRAEVVHQHVGEGDQALQHFAPGGRLQVDGDALLAGVGLHRHHALREQVAVRISRGQLDLDHARAEVGEHAGGQRGGDDRRDLQDRHARQRAARLGDRRRAPRRALPALAEHLFGVGTGSGSGTARASRRSAQPRDRSQPANGPELGVRHIHHVAVRDEVGVVERLLRRQPGLRRHVAVGAEDLHPRVGRTLAYPQQDPIARRLQIVRLPGGGRALKALLGQELRQQLDRIQEGVEQVLEQIAELDPATVGAHHRVVVERRHAASHAGRIGDGGAGTLRQLHEQQRHQVVRQEPLQQAGLHALPAARALARKQRRHDPLHGTQRAGVRGHRHRGEGGAGSPNLPLEHAHAAGARGHHALVGRVARPGSPLAPARDRAVDQRGIARAQRLRVGGEPRGARRRSGRHHHVGSVDQAVQALTPQLASEVEHDAALAAPPHGRGRQRREALAPRRLHHDHVGPEVGQDHGRETGHRPAAQVQDAHPLEYLHGRRVSHGPPC